MTETNLKPRQERFKGTLQREVEGPSRAVGPTTKLVIETTEDSFPLFTQKGNHLRRAGQGTSFRKFSKNTIQTEHT